MTNGKERQNERIESLLRKASLPEPSSELRERITSEATRIWNQTSLEIPWRIPVRRLVASAAAAVFVIWLAHCFSDYSVARWQRGGASTTSQQPSELDLFPEMPYAPSVRHLTSISRKYPATDASGLRHYIETMHRLLEETRQNEISNPTDPAGSRSRLHPDRTNSRSYS
jgi:hypothetical protein